MATDPFISTTDIVNYLGRGGTADPGMVIVADAACDMCRVVAEQTFNQVIGGTAILDGTGTDALILPEHPVTAAGTVSVNGTAITDYMVTANGMLLRGSAGIDPRPVWPAGRQNVTVTYDHGYASNDIPRDVRMVALSLASRMAVQGVAKQETIGDVAVTYGVNATDLTANELRILNKYRRTRSF